ncbi:hypothetical protein QN277_014152 [Acacia crassicarpa]|uniref:HMA domain-containing protein n=1 Tax=Acacia crassicarpa TaxID=499986 RepID=A0AAE1N429_9FABA|nr:hypothetical protein QN277_014152 [Acacia crassicarpa]
MNKQDLLKLQTCVLKVNIHCEGCEHKVKKLLQKIDGVYSVNIDAEQGKVVVTGNVDPATLLKKLKSSGKRAELWAPKGMMFPTNQFKNLQLDHHVHGKGGKDNKKSHKGGKDHQKGGGQPQLFQYQNKGPNNFNLPAKDHKSVKFNMPGEEFDASDDEFDDYEDSEDDYEEEHVHTHAMPNKMMSGHKGKSGGGGGGKNAKKIDVMDLAEQIKAKNAGNGGKKGHEGGGKKHNHGGGGNKKNTKTSGGLLGRFLGFGKKGGDKSKDKKKEGGGGGGTGNNKKGKEGKKKKGGDKFEDEGYDFDDDEDDLDEFDIPQSHQGKGKGKGKGGNGGKNNSGKGNSNHGNVGQMGPIQMGQMEQMRNLMQMQGLPAMNGGGYYPGMQMQHHAPPQYQPQQPYMAPMMSHNYQQQPHLNSMYAPPTMMYGRPYMPPPPPIPVYPGNDPVTHAFNDENTEGCTVM